VNALATQRESAQTSAPPVCGSCGEVLLYTFADLGTSPLANSYLTAGQLNEREAFYPLHARVCSACFLVQLESVVSPQEIFSDYAYFSSFSESWLEHARAYAEAMVLLLHLNSSSWVVEIASNDGYLLQYFKSQGIPVLGIEPARNVAERAIEHGIPTKVKFFSEDTARDLVDSGKRADLIVGNNVLAHVPDLNGFVAGLKILLAPGGTITLEFPHLMRLIEHNEFDTIYHEHIYYFSLNSVSKLLSRHELRIVDIDELTTHGGSLRIYARHTGDLNDNVSPRVTDLLSREESAGLTSIANYISFQEQIQKTKRRLLQFLIAAKDQGKSVVGYGAPAKGNTLLNYCGIRNDFIDYTVDRSPHKQRLFLPGTHIAIHSPEKLKETRPDFVLVLPWNLKDEIADQMQFIRGWGGRFVVPIPEVQLLP
jgi:SAM-dependent methyltransferase